MRDAVRRFAAEEIAPHFERWELSGIVDRSFWHRSGERGLLCPKVPEEYGGVGADFRTNSIVIEELGYAGFAGPASELAVHSDVCCGYLLHLGTSQQKARWLPGMVTGQTVAASRFNNVNARLSMSAASIAKLWAAEMHGRVVDQCLQLFGGYGVMRESEICRLYADARVQRIYGGTSEIMREIIARDL